THSASGERAIGALSEGAWSVYAANTCNSNFCWGIESDVFAHRAGSPLSFAAGFTSLPQVQDGDTVTKLVGFYSEHVGPFNIGVSTNSYGFYSNAMTAATGAYHFFANATIGGTPANVYGF